MTRPEHVVGLVTPWVEYADELEKRIAELEKHIKFQAEEACEGMCTEGNGGQGRFEDCQGCEIYKVLLEGE